MPGQRGLVPEFSVSVFERDFSTSVPLRLEGVRFVVERYDHEAIGGPKEATVKAYGDYWALWGLANRLRCPIVIYNQYLTPVWWGFIAAVDVAAGAVSIGVDLDTMYNRVAVSYQPTTAAGGEMTAEQATTAWAEDADSIAAYGYREMVHSATTEMDAATAAAYAATLLAKYKVPTPTVKFGGALEHCATLTCRGWWSALSWRMLYNYEGRHIYEDAGSGEQFCGWGETNSKVGFTFTDKRIMDIDANIDDLVKGQMILVEGSASNDGSYTVKQGTDTQQKNYTATTISFDSASKEIRDSAYRLTNMNSPDLIEVSGSSDNDGVYSIASGSADGSKVVVAEALNSDSEGDSITLVRGQHISVEESLTDESVGASITLTCWGEKVAQKFTFDHNVSWAASGLQVRCKRKRAPTDNLQILLHSDSSGSPGFAVAYGSYAGADMSDSMDWIAVTLNTDVTLTYGTDYWIVVQRSGANSHENYYVLDVNGDCTYTGGAMKLYDGAAWQAWSTTDMPFRVTGTLPTTEQIDDDVTAYGQFVADVLLTDTSTLETCQYRDGSRNLQDEVEEMLKIGNSSSKRMLARINVDRVLEVYAEPDPSEDYFIDADGTVRRWTNSPLEPGAAPVAIWANLRDVAEVAVNLDAIANPSQFFVELAEYDATTGEWMLEPHEEDGSAFDLRWVTKLAQG
jgi:hypothetical protein